MNNACHPPAAMRGGASNPATMPPAEMPMETTVSVRALLPGGANSATSAVTFGKHAPSDKPVASLHSVNPVTVPPAAVPSDVNAIRADAVRITGRRPTRSPIGAISTAPSPSPSSTAESATPKDCGGTPSWADKCGTTSGRA